jgi:hypothetical protein
VPLLPPYCTTTSVPAGCGCADSILQCRCSTSPCWRVGAAFCLSGGNLSGVDPVNYQQMAGLMCMYDTDNHYYLQVTWDEEKGRVLWLQCVVNRQTTCPSAPLRWQAHGFICARRSTTTAAVFPFRRRKRMEFNTARAKLRDSLGRAIRTDGRGAFSPVHLSDCLPRYSGRVIPRILTTLTTIPIRRRPPFCHNLPNTDPSDREGLSWFPGSGSRCPSSFSYCAAGVIGWQVVTLRWRAMPAGPWRSRDLDLDAYKTGDAAESPATWARHIRSRLGAKIVGRADTARLALSGIPTFPSLGGTRPRIYRERRDVLSWASAFTSGISCAGGGLPGTRTQ